MARLVKLVYSGRENRSANSCLDSGNRPVLCGNNPFEMGQGHKMKDCNRNLYMLHVLDDLKNRHVLDEVKEG